MTMLLGQAAFCFVALVEFNDRMEQIRSCPISPFTVLKFPLSDQTVHRKQFIAELLYDFIDGRPQDLKTNPLVRRSTP
ncbi:MAG: hypothetical protein NNA20_09590 [Nitrospira sp.]|nr:hypothetical protein [Nitrospira sp.]